ncbi:MAG: hypothetical protein BGO12_19280 [Verrucomicrobia bacterium 61-8]|nr:hypothetical protein [Verrucomicrobiota bacterium]OJV07525.1 MAG: hypothetical protein BGO12_19280 [Verrucomicrobia bacterium 61-8]
MAFQRRTRIYVLVAAFVLLIAAVRPVASFLLWHGPLGRAGKQSLAEVDRKLKLVKIDMTREEVRAIMGDPVSIVVRDDADKEVWIFARPHAASEDPRCVFDRTSGRVVRVIPYE